MNGKIIFFKGPKGSGKTLSIVFEGYGYLKDGWTVYRNFSAVFGQSISNDKILRLHKDKHYHDCVIMIDEIQILFDSRRGGKKESLNFSYFIQQIRKKGIIILATSQFANTVDLRFRQNVDITAFPRFSKDLEVCEIQYVDINSVDILTVSKYAQFDNVKIVFDAREVFKLYDTNEVIRR